MTDRAEIQDVNIDLGDDVSRMLYEASLLTHANRPDVTQEAFASFSGARAMSVGALLGDHATNLSDVLINLGSDGIGTKAELSERTDIYRHAAYDLFAMVCDDAVVRGGEPVAINTILDVRQLNDTPDTRRIISELAEGYVGAAAAAGVVVTNGEVAELGDRVGGHGAFNYNWGATVLWLAHRSRYLTGHQLAAGDTLIGLAEQGFRSNGITDVRKAMLEAYGPEWHNTTVPELGDQSLGELVQRPSTIYTKFVTSLTGGYDIRRPAKAAVTGVAHITGGGQPSKLGRLLEPSGLGVYIDNPLAPPDIMLHVQQLRGFSDEQAYHKWHMGPGMVIATPEPDTVLTEAAAQGFTAQAIGEVVPRRGINTKNMGASHDTGFMYFDT